MNDDFPDEHLLAVEDKGAVPWFADYVNYLVAKVVPPEFNCQQKKRFFAHLKHYYWDEPILYKHCADQVIRRCVPEDEMNSVLNHCHTLPRGGHFCGQRCHAPNPGPTRSADPNRVRGTRLRTGTLYLIFFFKSQLAPVGMAHIL